MQDALRFLQRVLPWPASPTDAGYGNIHWVKPNPRDKGPKGFFNGKPFKSAADAVGLVGWLLNKPATDVTDIYFCTSLQAETQTHPKTGKVNARRDVKNTLCSKVLFLDIDVKPPPKGYVNIVEGLTAVGGFCGYLGIPKPTAVVSSGGGVHCYWIGTRALPTAEWLWYAERLKQAAAEYGLRTDAMVTADIVRILRVPETFNHKTNPPKPVLLLKLRDDDIDFDAVLKPAFANVTVTVTARAVAAGTPQFAPLDPSVFPPRPVSPAWCANLESAMDGLDGERPELPPLDPEAIFTGCKFMGRALTDGGATYDQPQWMLSVLATTFMRDGRKIAHKISNGHAGYTQADTDALYDRKEKDKAELDLGFPRCATIEASGCKECALCPHRAADKSPLNLGIVKRRPQPAPGIAGVATLAMAPTAIELRPGWKRWDQFMPDGYAFNQAGIPCKIDVEKEKDNEGNVEYTPILVPLLENQQMLEPMCHTDQTLSFYIDGHKQDSGEVALLNVFISRGTLTSPQETLKVLATQGVAYNTEAPTLIGKFMTSLMRKMEMMTASINAKPFGWLQDDKGVFNKFAYGGRIFHADGRDTPGGFIDAEMRKQYGACGTIDAWLEAVDFIMSQNRQDYAVYMACGFAAPLYRFTGQPMCTVPLYNESGKGKTTCLHVTSGIWGHPDDSLLKQQATRNHVGRKMAMLANLPIGWDDLSEPPAQEEARTLIMSNGTERQRMYANGKNIGLQDGGHWATIMLVTANASLIQYCMNKMKTSSAAAYRIFELRAFDIKSDISHWYVDQMIGKMHNNFGNAGMIFARHITMMHDKIEEMLIERGLAFDALVGAKREERNWSKVAACILLAAEFARDLGLVKFDVPAMREYLAEQFMVMRRRVEDEGQDAPDRAAELLTGFFKANYNRILITDDLPRKGGTQKILNVLRRPETGNGSTKYPTFIQFVARDVKPVCRIGRAELHAWLDLNEYTHTVVYDRLEPGSWRVNRGLMLGGGTPYVSGSQTVLEIDIKKGDWLDRMMNGILGNDDPNVIGEEDPTPPAPVTPTGNTVTLSAVDTALAAAMKDRQNMERE